MISAPAAPADPRQRLRWLRIWQERRAGSGGSLAEAEAALQDASIRALLLLLDRQADAVMISEADPGWRLAWRALEPRAGGGGTCSDLWIGTAPFPGSIPWDFGWLDWPDSENISATAEKFLSAANEISAACGVQNTIPLVVNFAGGKNPQARSTARLLGTLRARTSAVVIDLYSPLFYAEGELQAGACLRAVRQHWDRHAGPAAGAAVLCIPQLSRKEFASALIAAGGSWAGAFRAGAEAPAARLAADASPAQCAATVAWLQRLAQAR